MKNLSISEIAKTEKKQSGNANRQIYSYNGINGDPLLISKAKGSKLYSADKEEYIDFCLSDGVHILGHAPHILLNAVEDVLWDGKSYGMSTVEESVLSNLISKTVPSMEQVQIVNSEAEAFLGAIRLSRIITGKKKIISFNGGFHLTQEVSSISNLALEVIDQTINLTFNDELLVFETFARYKNEIAAVVVEPVPANMGLVLPKEGFLQFLRKITQQFHALLIFDEVTTGFRPKIGGAQSYFEVGPDITILGKIMGGGFPIGAYGSSKEMMHSIANVYNNYQDRTYAGNPIAVKAGIAAIQRLQAPLFYETLNHKSRDFIFWLKEITKEKGIVINSFQSMFTIYFTENEIHNYEDAKKSDKARFEKFFRKSLDKGLYFTPSHVNANFISAAHLPEELNKTLELVYQILKSM
jgi:glutamate-1-semialdehyde 2,1-aminomutase